MNRVFHCSVSDFSTDAVDQSNGREDGRRVGSAIGFGANFKTGEWLAFLFKNADHVGAGASAERDEDQFDGTVGDFFFTDVYHDGMARACGTDVLISVRPGGFSVNQWCLTFFAICDLQLPIVDCFSSPSSGKLRKSRLTVSPQILDYEVERLAPGPLGQ